MKEWRRRSALRAERRHYRCVGVEVQQLTSGFAERHPHTIKRDVMSVAHHLAPNPWIRIGDGAEGWEARRYAD